MARAGPCTVYGTSAWGRRIGLKGGIYCSAVRFYSKRSTTHDISYLCGQCNLLFLAGGSESLPTENATNMNVLTVSDMPDFAYNGGMVELTRTQNRVALTVNTGATAAASIQLSSRLLALATVISPEDSARHEN